MTEAISIAKADAIMQNQQDNGGWNMAQLGTLVVIIIFALAGIGIAYKIAFG
jgi:hypothetical protein